MNKSCMFILLIVVGGLLISVDAKCSVVETDCYGNCCCVTCSCNKSEKRCYDMWDKPTEPTGRADDPTRYPNSFGPRETFRDDGEL